MKSIIDKIQVNQSTEPKTLTKYHEATSIFDQLTSTHFEAQEKLLFDIFNTETNTESKDYESKRITELEKEQDYSIPTTYHDQILLESWKNIENISARLIEFNESNVVLECLIDKERGVYEERNFKPSFFADYEISIGRFFCLRFFERRNEIKLQIHDDPSSSLQDDFPKTSLSEKYKNSRLFK